MLDQRSGQDKARELLSAYRKRHEEVHGRRPGDEELLRLLDGRLSEERAEEVLSHLVDDPELTQHWYSLARARGGTPTMTEEPPSQWELVQRGINNWVGNWRYAALGVALLAAVIAALHFLQPEPREATIQPPAALDPAFPGSHFPTERQPPEEDED